MAIIPSGQEIKWILEESLERGEYLDHCALGSHLSHSERIVRFTLGYFFGVKIVPFLFIYGKLVSGFEPTFFQLLVIFVAFFWLVTVFAQAWVVGLTNRRLIVLRVSRRGRSWKYGLISERYFFPLGSLPPIKVGTKKSHAKIEISAPNKTIKFFFENNYSGAWRSDYIEGKQIVEALTKGHSEGSEALSDWNS